MIGMFGRAPAAGRGGARSGAAAALAALGLGLAAGCVTTPPSDEDALIERGRDLFFNETFNGNGRTCSTCHREEDNFGLSPAFIATLPDDDPLFVAERAPGLGRGFENPRLMRGLGLITENLDGFSDLDNVFVLRGVPHTLALRTSSTSKDGPRMGWSGDGAPGDGTLRSFATGAVVQHFPLTTDRIPGVDFRLPTDDELDALEAFMLSLGRQADLELPLALKDPTAIQGQEIFLDPEGGKCFACHMNAGANADPAVFGADAGNMNFDTGVEDLPGQPQDLVGELVPPDDGFGSPGDGTFNTPPLVEAADTGPFFHNNSVQTLEAAVAFYDGDSFNESPAGELVIDATGSGIELDATEIEALADFLRVLNALENIREATAYLEDAQGSSVPGRPERGLRLAPEEINDAIRVLEGGSLNRPAVLELRESLARLEEARGRPGAAPIGAAIAALEAATALMRD